jgi:hypothetical protein
MTRDILPDEVEGLDKERQKRIHESVLTAESFDELIPYVIFVFVNAMEETTDDAIDGKGVGKAF